jgi:hypothetical protein
VDEFLEAIDQPITAAGVRELVGRTRPILSQF